MRILVAAQIAALALTSSAFATHANQNRANFWQLNFQANYGGNASLPVAFVQAHVGEADYGQDSQGQPNWDSNQALVDLKSQNGHFYASFVIEHHDDPEMFGGARGPVVQYHYFLKGEESQIDSQHPFSGGHWTAPVIYVEPSDQVNSSYMVRNVLTANDDDQYEQLKTQVKAGLAQDASETSVVEVRYDFAD